MKTRVKLKIYLLMILCWSFQFSLGQNVEVVEPSIVLEPGATIEWGPDGEAIVTGTAKNTSAISKAYNNYADHNFTSALGPLVDPNYFETKSYTVSNVTEIDELNNVVVNKNFNNGVALTNASENGRYYIDMYANTETSVAEVRMHMREPIKESDDLNTTINNYGYALGDALNATDYLKKDRWIIFAGENGAGNANQGTGRLRNLFDLPQSKFFRVSLEAKQIPSSDYERLFNSTHLESKRWRRKWMKNHEFEIALTVLTILYEFYAFEIIAEQVATRLVEEYMAEQVALYDANTVRNVVPRAAKYAEYRAAFYSNPNNGITLAYNATRNSVLANLLAHSVTSANDKTVYGSFNNSDNTFVNVPNYTQYSEYEFTDFDVDVSSGIAVSSKTGLPCNTSAFSSESDARCKQKHLLPVVITMNITDATVYKVALPGMGGTITPYQLFRNPQWEPESDFTIDHTTADANLLVVESNAHFGSLGSAVIQELPGHIVKESVVTASGYTVDLEMEENQFGFYNFYLVSKLQSSDQVKAVLPADDNDGDPNDTPDLIKYINDLGDYTDDGAYKLYKIGVNKSNISLNLDGNTYVAGDHLILDNYYPYDLLFVGPGTETFTNETPLDYLDGDGNPVFNEPETQAVISGAVFIGDEDLIETDEEIIATENYGLYVDKVGDAEDGILTNNMALLDTHNIPDFVFEEDYRLQSLIQLEDYLKENKHLPYIIGKEQLKEEGVFDAKDMLYGQLQHLEEFYLHAINQEKSIKALQQNSEDLDVRLQLLDKKLQQLEKQ